MFNECSADGLVVAGNCDIQSLAVGGGVVGGDVDDVGAVTGALGDGGQVVHIGEGKVGAGVAHAGEGLGDHLHLIDGVGLAGAVEQAHVLGVGESGRLPKKSSINTSITGFVKYCHISILGFRQECAIIRIQLGSCRIVTENLYRGKKKTSHPLYINTPRRNARLRERQDISDILYDEETRNIHLC